MLTHKEAIQDTIRINSARLNKLNVPTIQKLAIKYDVEGRGDMRKVELIKQLAPMLTFEDFDHE